MRGDHTTELSFTGPAQPACLEHVHDLLARLWDEQPAVASEDRVLFTTAVVEVANNIVEHGRRTEPVELSLRLRLNDERMEAHFRDDGGEVHLDIGRARLPEDFAESGRGLSLVRAAVDEFGYQRTAGVNRWDLVRRRDGVHDGGGHVCG